MISILLTRYFYHLITFIIRTGIQLLNFRISFWNKDIKHFIGNQTTLISLSIYFTSIVIKQKNLLVASNAINTQQLIFTLHPIKKYFTHFINGRLFFIWSSHFSLNAHSGYLTVIRMVACQWQSLSTQCINLQEQELTKNLCFYLKFTIWTVSRC